MNELKVKIDNRGPDREMIRKYKNFDRFMDRYTKYYSTRGIREMLYNDKRNLIYIVIILLSLLLILISYEESESREKSQVKDTSGTEMSFLSEKEERPTENYEWFSNSYL